MQRLRRWSAVAALWLLWGLFQSSRLRFEIPDIDWPAALRFGMPDAVIWAALTPVVVTLARRFPLVPGRMPAAVGLHLVLALGITILHAVIDTLWNFGLTDSLMRAGAAGRLFRHLMTHGFHWNFVIYMVIVGVTAYRQAERRAMDLRARLSEARLDALRMQLRPHFLFNTLHTVSCFMGQDPRRGRRIIRRLGDLLRAALRPREEEEIPLEEELGLVRAYLEIEQARFGQRLRTRIEVEPDTLNLAVPALVLQPLVENAVRHGIEPLPQGGTVTLRASRRKELLEIRLSDDGSGLPAPELGETQRSRGRETRPGGIGLANTRARLEELYGGEHTFRVERRDGGGTRVVLKLPARCLTPAARPRSA